MLETIGMEASAEPAQRALRAASETAHERKLIAAVASELSVQEAQPRTRVPFALTSGLDHPGDETKVAGRLRVGEENQGSAEYWRR